MTTLGFAACGAQTRDPTVALGTREPETPPLAPMPSVDRGVNEEASPGSTQDDAERPSAAAAHEARPWLGIEMRQSRDGVVVDHVYPRSPAARAGLETGDLLQRLGDEGIGRPTDVHAVLSRVTAGAWLSAQVARGGQQHLLRVELAPRPTLQELLTAVYVDEPAPSISTLIPIRGSVVPSFEQLKGNVVVLEFWASWCVACRALTPELNRWNEEREVLGLRVLGVTMDPIELASASSYEFKMDFSVHVDEDGDVTRAYRASAVPTVFVIDKRGTVRDVMVGFNPPKLLELHLLIDQLLEEG